MPVYHRTAVPTAIAPDGIEIRDLVNTPQGSTKVSVNLPHMLQPL